MEGNAFIRDYSDIGKAFKNQTVQQRKEDNKKERKRNKIYRNNILRRNPNYYKNLENDEKQEQHTELCIKLKQSKYATNIMTNHKLAPHVEDQLEATDSPKALT